MVKTEKGKKKCIFVSVLIVCLITILSIGITAKAEKTPSCDESKTKVEELRELLPKILGCDGESFCEILQECGYSFMIEYIDESEMEVEELRELLPNILGYDRESFCEILREYGYSYIIEYKE